MMKTKTLLLGAVASIAFAGPASAGHGQGWYVGLEGGVNWVQNIDFDSGTVFAPPPDATGHLDPGWALLGTVGHAFPGGWRVELEAGYRENNLAKFTTTGGSTPFTNSDVDEFTLMANVLFDIPMSGPLALTLGAGIGGDDVTVNLGGPPAVQISASSWEFAYQGIVGLSYSLPGTRWDLTTTYRYLVIDDATLTFPGPITITSDNITKHTLAVGFRYDFAPPPP